MAGFFENEDDDSMHISYHWTRENVGQIIGWTVLDFSDELNGGWNVGYG